MCAMRGMDGLVELPPEPIRPEFLERYRVVTNGARFQVQQLRRGGWLWRKWVWKDIGEWQSDGGWGTGDEWAWDEYPSKERALNRMLWRALWNQWRHDEAVHGWQPV